MKAEELMIGDWVYVYILCYERVRITKDNFSNPIFFPRIKPIPITLEILEKNGFTLEKYITDYEEYVSENKQVILNHHSNTPDKDWCCHIDNESMETIGCADIQYVHELQHLLKLCNVNIVIEV